LTPIFDAHNWRLVPFHFWSLVFFVFGCIVGSFLNVCIYRLPLGMSIVTPPSHCPHCKYSIPWYLNIPLVTWLALRGRCKNCGAPISPRYFIVELLTGVAFLGCWLAFGNAGSSLSFHAAGAGVRILLAGLIVATFIDFEHFIIPDEITLRRHGRRSRRVVFPAVAARRAHAGRDAAERARRGGRRGNHLRDFAAGKIVVWPAAVEIAGGHENVFTETSVHLPDREIPYDELFYRKSDVIVLRARTVELVDRGYEDVMVRLSPVAAENGGGERLNPDDVPHLEAVSAEIILPREAMGLGDVKFMGAIGAFIGWQGVMFSLMVSSMIGAAVGVALILMRNGANGRRGCLTGLTSRWRRRSGFSAGKKSSTRSGHRPTLRHKVFSPNWRVLFRCQRDLLGRQGGLLGFAERQAISGVQLFFQEDALQPVFVGDQIVTAGNFQLQRPGARRVPSPGYPAFVCRRASIPRCPGRNPRSPVPRRRRRRRRRSARTVTWRPF
jgi:leader peptidase (prepilin peptidase) / N-methyltransferase